MSRLIAKHLLSENRKTFIWKNTYAESDGRKRIETARIKTKYRRVSLADCLAIALTDRLGCEIVTSDHHEFDALVDQDVCRVMFIR